MAASAVNDAVSQAVAYLVGLDEHRQRIREEIDIETRRASAIVLIGHPATQPDVPEEAIYETIRTLNTHLVRVEVLTYKELVDNAERSIGGPVKLPELLLRLWRQQSRSPRTALRRTRSATRAPIARTPPHSADTATGRPTRGRDFMERIGTRVPVPCDCMIFVIRVHRFCCAAGASPWTVMKTLGHSQFGLTMNTYTDPDEMFGSGR